ncbi:MAG: hypothetical protein WDZ80_04590 [Candidatus Paceibacterota bacterium]
MAKRTKTVSNNKSGIDKLPNDKPVTCKIKTDGGNTNYVGSAKRGSVQDRLKEHLPGGKDYIPGSKIHIQQHSSIRDAQQHESRSIKQTKPRYNKKGK